MENINFKNGILIQNNDAYNLYHMFFRDLSEFIMTTPKKDSKKYKIIIYFNNINFKSENIDPGDLITPKISTNIAKIYEDNPNAICIIPSMSKREFNDILAENDDRSYKRLLDQLDKTINYAYWSIKENLIFTDTLDIEERINIVKQSEEDVKFFWWLELNKAKTNQKIYQQITIEKPQMELFIPGVADNKKEVPVETKQEEVKTLPRRQTMTRTKKRPKGDGIHSTGYSNMAFMIMVLSISLLMGLGLAILILK